MKNLLSKLHRNRHFLYCLLACVLFSTVVRGQDVKCDNVIVDGDTITIKIFTYEYPSTEKQFTYLLNKLGDEIKFKDDSWDGLKFWLYISIINDFNKYTDFKQAFEKLISQMNRWLRDKYGQYAR
jgi:hypothetical protein